MNSWRPVFDRRQSIAFVAIGVFMGIIMIIGLRIIRGCVFIVVLVGLSGVEIVIGVIIIGRCALIVEVVSLSGDEIVIGVTIICSFDIKRMFLIVMIGEVPVTFLSVVWIIIIASVRVVIVGWIIVEIAVRWVIVVIHVRILKTIVG